MNESYQDARARLERRAGFIDGFICGWLSGCLGVGIILVAHLIGVF